MIKFFSRIRRKLIDEGNLKRYLIYGVGEIVLVVIGILIALQINNNNIKNIQKETLQEYFAQLTLEFNSLIVHEENQINRSELIISQIQLCQQLINQRDSDKILEFKNCLPYLHSTWLNRLQYPIFKEFLDEGWMSKIDDDTTKNHLIRVREKLLVINEMDGIISKKYEEIVSPFFIRNINRSELANAGETYVEFMEGGVSTNFDKLYDNMELWGLLNEKHGVTAYMKMQQQELIDLLEETINILKYKKVTNH